MKTEDAIAKAKEQGLDLVEVAPKAQPPVCKIMDYSKYIYRQKKKARKNRKKSKQKDMKEFKFSPVIDVGDINTRVRRATEYLEKGHPVRITMYRRGRQSREQAEKVFNEILTNFDEYSSIEPTPKKEGRNMYITFFKKNG
jgi:translation initiation factor IF-3